MWSGEIALAVSRSSPAVATRPSGSSIETEW
jgi:hypothetical protein